MSEADDLQRLIAKDEVRISFKAFATPTPGIVIHPTAIMAWPGEKGRLVYQSAVAADARWCVTHAASGKGLARFKTKEAARTFAARLGNGKVDWLMDENDLRLSGAWERIGRAIKKLREELGGEI